MKFQPGLSHYRAADQEDFQSERLDQGQGICFAVVRPHMVPGYDTTRPLISPLRRSGGVALYARLDSGSWVSQRASLQKGRRHLQRSGSKSSFLCRITQRVERLDHCQRLQDCYNALDQVPHCSLHKGQYLGLHELALGSEREGRSRVYLHRMRAASRLSLRVVCVHFALFWEAKKFFSRTQNLVSHRYFLEKLGSGPLPRTSRDMLLQLLDSISMVLPLLLPTPWSLNLLGRYYKVSHHAKTTAVNGRHLAPAGQQH